MLTLAEVLGVAAPLQALPRFLISRLAGKYLHVFPPRVVILPDISLVLRQAEVLGNLVGDPTNRALPRQPGDILCRRFRCGFPPDPAQDILPHHPAAPSTLLADCLAETQAARKAGDLTAAPPSADSAQKLDPHNSQVLALCRILEQEVRHKRSQEELRALLTSFRTRLAGS